MSLLERFVDDLARHAGEIFLIGSLFVILIALFIAGMGVLRFLEWLSPPFSRWVDRNLEPSIWDEP